MTLLREALATAWASRVSSLLTISVVAAMCCACLLTVGRSAAAAGEIAARMEQAGARRLSVVDTAAAGFINPRTLSMIQGLSTVETANALGSPVDVVNGAVGAGGPRIPAWPILGEVASTITLVRGRIPQPGEAMISTTIQQTLGLTEPVGFLSTPDGTVQYPVVGSFSARAPFEDLGAGALIAAPGGAVGRELRVVIDDITSATPTVAAILTTLSPPDPQAVSVESPTAIADTARDLNAQMAGYGRSLLLMILSVGGFFVASVTLADVLIRRRDLGRRRTLGITRSDLATLVTTRTLTVAVLGAGLGCAVGWAVNRYTGYLTPIPFTASVGILAALVAGLAAIPPAWYAARLDPVRVMRTP
ncbi:MAG: FtsX-like permease family protein [Propionicimonas sp.]|nr:FtsX-like permease family protein [Propionicimonas sp.]